MALLKKFSVGFVLTPGFRAADVVETGAILSVHPRNKAYYIADRLECVYGKSNFPIVPNATFSDCPHLDVLVIGEVSDAELERTSLIEFIAGRYKDATYVIAISNGVAILGKAGALRGINATADSVTMNTLAHFGAHPVDQRQPVVDGKFYTAGPSTGAIEAAFMVMRELRGNLITKSLELNMEYDPRQQFPRQSQSAKMEPYTWKVDAPPKVAVLTSPGMHVSDIMGAVDVFGSIPGSEVRYVWKEKIAVKGILLGPILIADTTFDECPQSDVLVVGMTSPNLIGDKQVTDFFHTTGAEGVGIDQHLRRHLHFRRRRPYSGEKCHNQFSHDALIARPWSYAQRTAGRTRMATYIAPDRPWALTRPRFAPCTICTAHRWRNTSSRISWSTSPIPCLA